MSDKLGLSDISPPSTTISRKPYTAGSRFVAANSMISLRSAYSRPPGLAMSAWGFSCLIVVNASCSSPGPRSRNVSRRMPSALAIASDFAVSGAFSSSGDRNIAAKESLGTNSFKSSKYFGTRLPCAWKVTPVTLPSGRGRLATRPLSTAAPPARKTTGMLLVAFFTATVPAGVHTTIKSTLSRTTSAAAPAH
jgi:hypothetical protein